MQEFINYHNYPFKYKLFKYFINSVIFHYGFKSNLISYFMNYIFNNYE